MVEYGRLLRRILARARELVKQRLFPALPSLVAERLDEITGGFSPRMDAPGKKINKLMDDIESEFFKQLDQGELEKALTRVGQKTANAHKRELGKQLRAALAVDPTLKENLSPAIADFVAENVALIKTLPSKYFSDIEQQVISGVRAGLRWEEIALGIEGHYGPDEKAVARSRLIARDQVGKFFGELNKTRQQDLGIDSYVWRTVEDERVREEHRKRDGKVFQWDNPPGEDPTDPGTGGHPGIAINCRCWPEPVIPGLDNG